MDEVDPPKPLAQAETEWVRAAGASKSGPSGRTLSAHCVGTFPVAGKEGVDCVHDSVELLVDLVVPNPVHLETLCTHPIIPISITALVVRQRVLSATNLDHQP